MNIDTDNIEKRQGNLPYQQPNLKKYGTMKKFTLKSNGSGSDGMGPGDTTTNERNFNDEKNQNLSILIDPKPVNRDRFRD